MLDTPLALWTAAGFRDTGRGERSKTDFIDRSCLAPVHRVDVAFQRDRRVSAFYPSGTNHALASKGAAIDTSAVASLRFA